MKIRQANSRIIDINLMETGGYSAYKQHEDKSGYFSFANDDIVCVRSETLFTYLATKDKEFYNSLKTCDKNIWHGLFENYLFRKLAEHGQTREFIHMLCGMKYNAGAKEGRRSVQNKMKEALGIYNV